MALDDECTVTLESAPASSPTHSLVCDLSPLLLVAMHRDASYVDLVFMFATIPPLLRCGLDEISPIGPSQIVEIKNTAAKGKKRQYEKKTFTFDPLDVGIPRCSVLDLKGGEPEENMLEFRKVLEGGSHSNAKRDSVVLNAGFGCYVYGLSSSIEEGVKLARDTLESGKATQVLENWIKVSSKLE